jgi:ATP-dependent Clp protease adaptor protein ClpS
VSASEGARARRGEGEVTSLPPDAAERGLCCSAVAGTSDERHKQGSVLERTRQKEARPPKYKVVLYNDDYTPMQFVVNLLETVFRKSPVEANALMLQIHRGGKGIAGVYTHEVAETKVAKVHKLAEERGYPLRAGVEAE